MEKDTEGLSRPAISASVYLHFQGSVLEFIIYSKSDEIFCLYKLIVYRMLHKSGCLCHYFMGWIFSLGCNFVTGFKYWILGLWQNKKLDVGGLQSPPPPPTCGICSGLTQDTRGVFFSVQIPSLPQGVHSTDLLANRFLV